MRGIRAGREITSIAIAALIYISATGAVSLHAAQDAVTPPTSLDNALPKDATGADIFRMTCSTCHGIDGKGSPQSVVGFDVPFPDFTDCSINTPEPGGDWSSVIHRGGPIRGLDHHMPAFGDALSDDQIDAVVKHLWSFCKDPSWPRGDLNYPRAFFTEKAFPENESVWTTGITGKGAKAVTNNLVYEHRIKQRSQYEITIPLDFQQSAPGGAWNRGLGDVEFALRRSFYVNLDQTLIIAAGGAVTLPTGKETAGLGEGVTLWEPFAMLAKGLGANGFVQMHGGVMLPSDTNEVPKATYLRQAWGYTYAQDHGFGRAWSPMTEIIWSKDKGGKSVVDVVPQMQVSLSKLQHILLSVGVRVPATERADRHAQFLTYFLWDWFDGGLTEFWH
jgi:mono/diheme cytochrome c family protein